MSVLTHRVVVTLFDGVDALDVIGPAEVFAMANVVLASGAATYELRTAGFRRGRFDTFTGVGLHADVAFDEIHARPDTVVVPGRVDMVDGNPVAWVDDTVVDWLKTHGKQAPRIAGACAGGHLLAAAGLLDGHRATTHWMTARQLADQHPLIEVDPDPIFVRSGHLWTSAGITSSMDLALALVADDHGNELARRVAQQMVMYVQRPGGQSQFSAPLAFPSSSRSDMVELRRWIADNLHRDFSVEILAGQASMTARHLTRLFRREMDTTPGQYVESLRLERARQLLERTTLGLSAVAAASGLGSVETLHRLFRARLGTTPGDYRKRFTAVDGHSSAHPSAT